VQLAVASFTQEIAEIQVEWFGCKAAASCNAFCKAVPAPTIVVRTLRAFYQHPKDLTTPNADVIPS